MPKSKKDSLEYENCYMKMPPPPTSISFCDDGKTIGSLSFGNGKMEFEGKADKSAKIFFEYFLKPIIDDYIKEKLENDKCRS